MAHPPGQAPTIRPGHPPNSSAAAPAPYRPFGLLRFALAMLVVVSHSGMLRTGVESMDFLRRVGLGNVGVMGFFALSGFIIAEACASFYRDRPVAFMANRALRLVPPYLAALVFSAAVHALLLHHGLLRLPDYAPDLADMPAAFTLPNLLINTTAIIPVLNFNNLFEGEWYYFVRYAWAVFVEFLFYYAMAGALVAGLVLRAAWLRLAAWQAGFAAAAALHLVNELVRPFHSAFGFIPYFLFGIALYAQHVAPGRLHALAVALGLILSLLHFARYTQGQLPVAADWIGGLGQAHVLAALALLAATFGVLAWLSRQRISARLAGLDRAAGDLSYPIYITHYVVIVLLFSLFPEPHALVQALAIALAPLAGLALHAAVERHTAGLRDRLRGTVLRAA